MVTLEITSGVILLGVAVIGAAAYAFYRVGEKNQSSHTATTQAPSPTNKYIKTNPSTPQAKKAFMENLPAYMPYFNGSTQITIDKEALTDAIITGGDQDLIALWKHMVNRSDLWLNQMAAWGVAPDNRTAFVAMEKHKGQYTTQDGGSIQTGKHYVVLSACWLSTSTNTEGVITKTVVKKGIVEEKA